MALELVLVGLIGAVYWLIIACCIVAGRADARIEAAMRAGMLSVADDPGRETMSELLDHADADCTGTWQLRPALDGGASMIRCTACDAEHARTPENRLAALRENELEVRLRGQVRQGASQLARERKPGGAA